MLRRLWSDEASLSVHEAATREDLMKHADAPPPVDLIFLDYYMPGVVGFELLHELREMYPWVPIILFTGAADQQLARQSVREGADAYMAKVLVNKYRVLQAIDRAQQSIESRREIQKYRELTSQIHTIFNDPDPSDA